MYTERGQKSKDQVTSVTKSKSGKKRLFGISYQDIWFKEGISYGSKALYGLLTTYRGAETNECHPTNRLLAEALEVSQRTIERWLKELEEHAIIARSTWFVPEFGNNVRKIKLLDQ